MEVNISLSGNPQEIAEVTGLFKDMKAEIKKLNDRFDGIKTNYQHVRLDNEFLHKEYRKIQDQLDETFASEKDAVLINVKTGEAKPTKVKFEK